MSVVLSVSLREKVGQKGALRSQRASGSVPGVVYGAKKDPVPISFSAKELKKAISQSSFQSHVQLNKKNTCISINSIERNNSNN